MLNSFRYSSAITERVALPEDMRRLLTSRKGVHLKTLQTEYRVNIDIDRANDELILRGGPEVVAKAKDALEHLFSGEATVEVPSRLIATIIGKQGSMVERLQEESGASINVSRADNNVVIRGTPETVAKAQEEILLLLEIHREHADDIALDGGQPMVMFVIGAKGKTAEGETIKAGWRINGLRKESGANLSIVDPHAKADGEGMTLPQLRLTGTCEKEHRYELIVLCYSKM